MHVLHTLLTHQLWQYYTKLSVYLWRSVAICEVTLLQRVYYLARHVMATILYSMHEKHAGPWLLSNIQIPFELPIEACFHSNRLLDTKCATRYFTRWKATTVNLLKPIFSCTFWNYMYTAQIVYKYITTDAICVEGMYVVWDEYVHNALKAYSCSVRNIGFCRCLKLSNVEVSSFLTPKHQTM
jgi:hypothetical protein